MNALKISTQGGVHTIMLSRPEVRNAFNDEVIAELKNAFLWVAQDSAVRCVVLAAEGPLSPACKVMCMRAAWVWWPRATWR